MVTTQTVSSFFFVLFELKYFFSANTSFQVENLYKKQTIKYSTHKLPSIKYTNNNSACKLPQNSNTKAHFCNRLPDNIKHCLTSSIPGSGQQVKSPISSHHMLSKHSHYLCLSDSALPVFPVMRTTSCFTIKVVFSKQKSLPGYNLTAHLPLELLVPEP